MKPAILGMIVSIATVTAASAVDVHQLALSLPKVRLPYP